MKNALITLLFCLFCFGSFGQELAKDFTLVDIYGEEHSLYEDYLDQGKTVLISFSAAWNAWDSVWISSGALQDFHSEYSVNDGEGVVLFIDPTGSTIDDLYGIGNDGIGYDFVDGNDFPIFTTNTNGLDSSILDDFEIFYFPTIRMICPDGTVYTDGNSNKFYVDTNLFYGELEDGQAIADRMFDNCGTSFGGNRLIANVYYDQNDNCTLENSEGPMPLIKAKITGPSGSFCRVSNKDGVFRSLMNENDYTVELISPNNLWKTCNSPLSIDFQSTDEEKTIDLGLQAETLCFHPTVSISSPLLRRCFDSDIFINYCNEGTELAQGAYIFLQLDNSLTFVDADYNYTIENGGVLFVLGDLDVWECGKIRVTVKVDCDVDLGTVACYSAKISPHVCLADSLFYDEECQEIRGAFDPNDKRSFPNYGIDDYKIEPNKEIKYQIRFQNTGTDTAFTVIVEDVLSENLDIGTLRTGPSSHNYDLEITEERKLRFLFNNIMLPDSNVNLPGSNGFLNYSIYPVKDLDLGTEIKNEAAIYFDFNEAVITNKTTHIIHENILAIDDTEIDKVDFSVSPNPASSIVILETNVNVSQEYQLKVYNIVGQNIESRSIVSGLTEIDLGSYQNGVYLLKLSDQNGKSTTKKLVVDK